MKRLNRLKEIKRQLGLVDNKIQRAQQAQKKLLSERSKLVGSFTEDEKRLYKEQIVRACSV